ncbi:hypothetical protein I6J18_05020 [Peribacillus psychrosaccharolyticus]|uniref:RCK C-terminal domain-containing protein n=1 Tax=Peribacillus psychrosaccharolyticus TaxID=1407 RepID=A0A974NNQ4_PERPY|nr:hypothetical protein [Peribacillus psychrosaccharolyticus]MEC2054114.1 hypothetical protein [Peribacillus psychrosaccharolyticus]MED3742265.1 hypothetical protein [Peribacillus psychrosaccharolyticus]QQT01249.1 hypothetical protein I6J18_05020 [Peribacillus psychrosaccharolyticus]
MFKFRTPFDIFLDNLRIKELSIIMAILMLIIIIVKLPFIYNRLSNKMHSEMHNHYNLWEHPIKEVLFLEDDDVVMKLDINKDSELINQNAGEVISRGIDINILFIKSGETKIRKKLSKHELKLGDKLFLYGNKKEIEENFSKEIEVMNKNNGSLE